MAPKKLENLKIGHEDQEIVNKHNFNNCDAIMLVLYLKYIHQLLSNLKIKHIALLLSLSRGSQMLIWFLTQISAQFSQ